MNNCERENMEKAADSLGIRNFNIEDDVNKNKKRIVRKANPQLRLDRFDQNYIDGRYQIIAGNKNIITDNKNNVQHEHFKSPREKFMEDSQNMWMTKDDREFKKTSDDELWKSGIQKEFEKNY